MSMYYNPFDIKSIFIIYEYLILLVSSQYVECIKMQSIKMQRDFEHCTKRSGLNAK